MPNTLNSPCCLPDQKQVFIRSVFLFLKRISVLPNKTAAVCLSVCLSVCVKLTPVIRNSDVRIWPLMMSKHYTTLRAVLLRFWTKYIFFCNKNNALKLYVRLKGSSPGRKCLFTLRSGLSAHGVTKGPRHPLRRFTKRKEQYATRWGPHSLCIQSDISGLDGNLPSHFRTDRV